MSQNILVVGVGVMGTHYTRNLVQMREELDIGSIICADTDPQKCTDIKDKFPEIVACHVPNGVASVIKEHNVDGIIGATQTDSHVSVLSNALSAGHGVPQIQRILQEKPFGLFADEDVAGFDSVVDTIKHQNIRFGMDSILMFSKVYEVFDIYLGANPDLIHIETTCLYGKDRTHDTRPAHVGVFGTEGTHAIDIARRIGSSYVDLSFDSGEITQGYLTERDPGVPYASKSKFHSSNDAEININMSLAFDRPYRTVTHSFRSATDEQITSVTLAFDQKNEGGAVCDTLQIIKSGELVAETQYSATNKLADSIRSVFGRSVQPYTLDQTLGLRSIIEDMRSRSQITRAKGHPTIARP